MSKGFVLNIPQTMLERINVADKKIEQLATTSEQASQRIINAFQQINTQGIDAFINGLNQAQLALNKLGSSNVAVTFQTVANSATQTVDKVNQLSTALGNVSGEKRGANVTNGHIESLTYQIETAKARLKELQDRFRFFTKGEGSKASSMGLVDTSAIQAEAKQLMNRINLLERMRLMERDAAQSRAKDAAIERENTQRWMQMEQEKRAEMDKTIQKQNELAKAANQQQQLGSTNAKQRADEGKDMQAYNKRQRELNATLGAIAKEEEAERKRTEAKIKADEKAAAAAEKAREREAKAAEKAAEAKRKADERASKAAIKNMEREQKEREKAERLRVRSASELFSMQGKQTTLVQLQQYSFQLQRTLANLDPKTKEWQKLNSIYAQTRQQIRGIKTAMDGVDGKQKQMINTADQLKRAFTTMFSISAIKNYITQIANTRGEFELQHRALQAILQDKDAADKIWSQTMQLALKSPYTVRQLTTYTKQLASYRVETEKLHGVTKQLADVSAGLGVDMQRLILAYGQVKAANYLRGTELRQFSEAGINMLGELSKYFSEIEHRAVSVGEVFDRISKRMVGFKDVEEVFNRIASEGGTFFNMQEIQSETLYGQIRNLRDAIDIMMNEIGMDNENTLKNTVQSLRDMVLGWREIAFYMNKIIVLFGIWKGVSLLVTLANSGAMQQLSLQLTGLILKNRGLTTFFDGIGASVSNMTKKMNVSIATAQKVSTTLSGLGAVAVTAGIMAVIILITELWRRLSQARREAKRLKEEQTQTIISTQEELNKNIDGYTKLVNRLKMVTKGSSEHAEIVRILNNEYGDHIGFIVDMNTKYQSLEQSINKVTQSLINKARMAAFEKAMSKVTEKFLEDSGKLREKVRESISFKNANDEDIFLTDSEIDSMFTTIEKRIHDNADYDFIKDAGMNAANTLSGLFSEAISDVLGKSITVSFKNNTWDASILKYVNRIKQYYLDEEKVIQRVNNLMHAGNELTVWQQRNIDELNNEMERELKTTNSLVEKDKIRLKYQEEIIKLRAGYLGKDDRWVQEQIKTLRYQSATIEDVNKKLLQAKSKFGSEIIDIVYINRDMANKSLREITENAVNQYQAQNALIKEQVALKKAGTAHDESALNRAIALKGAWEYLLSLLGREDAIDEKDKERKKEVANQVNLIKEMNKEYEKLEKKYSAIIATGKIRTAYAASAKEVGLGDISKKNFTDTDISLWLAMLKAKLPAHLQSIVSKALDNINAEINLDVQTKNLESIKKGLEKTFEQVEISKFIEDLGLSADFVKKYFNFDSIGLDDFKKRLVEAKGEYAKYGKDGEALYADTLAKIESMEFKSQQERLKKYLQYAKQAIGDRAKIKIKELDALAEIEKTFTKDEQKAEKKAAQDAIKRESAQETKKLEWEEFQKTDTFINLFKDLDSASEQLLNHTIKKLNEFKDQWTDIPLKDMRSIIDKINQLESKLVESSPMEAIKSLRNEGYKVGVNGNENLASLQAESIKQEEILLQNERKLAIYETILNYQTTGNNERAIAYATEMGIADAASLTKDSVTSIVNNLRSEVSSSRQVLANISSQVIKQKQIVAAYNKQASALGDAQKMTDDLISAFVELAKAAGADSDGVGMVFAEMGQSMLNTVLNTIMLQIQLNAATVAAQGLGVAMNMAMGIVGWIVMAVQLIATALAAIFNAKDKRLQNQIETLSKEAEKLDDKFKKLAESIDEIYSIDSLQGTNEELRETNKLLLENYRNQRELQKQRKQTDEVKDEIAELNEKIAEAEKDLADALADSFSHATDGILDSAIETATEFVDAWYDAFQETGDGMSGLEENFDEMLTNMIKKQAALSVVGVVANRWKEALEAAFFNDDKLSTDEIRAWAADVKNDLPALNEALREYFGVFDEAIGGSGKLSGLEEGIAGASEETVQIVAAYLNSIRYFVADNNAINAQLRDVFISTDDMKNPMLAQLRIIAKQTSYIYTLLTSVVKDSGHPESGAGIKVFIN